MSKVAKLVTSRMPLSKLAPHPKNPRDHPKPGSQKWEALKASLKHDYFDPLVWNKRNGMLVSGHLRLKILQEAGYSAADVSVVDYDEETHLARMLAANGHQGRIDQELMSAALKELDGNEMAMGLSGFTEEAMEAALESLDADQADNERSEAVAVETGEEEKATKQAQSLRARKLLKKACEACGYKSRLVSHHIDQDNSNNEPKNVQTLCKHCHDFWHTVAKRLGWPIAGRMPNLAKGRS